MYSAPEPDGIRTGTQWILHRKPMGSGAEPDAVRAEWEFQVPTGTWSRLHFRPLVSRPADAALHEDRRSLQGYAVAVAEEEIGIAKVIDRGYSENPIRARRHFLVP